MTLLEKINNLKWFPDLPYKLKEIFQEITTFNILPLSNVFTGVKNIFNGNVGVGTDDPSGKFHVVSNSPEGGMLFDRYGGQPKLSIRRANGSKTAPTAVVSGASSVISFENYDGATFRQSAVIQVVPESITPTNSAGRMAFYTTNLNSVTPTANMVLSSLGNLGINKFFSDAGARLEVLADASQPTLALFKAGGNVVVDSNERLGIGTTTPTANLHIKAGTASANTAPIKLTAGTNLTTPENGAFEFDGTNLYFTVGGIRKTVTLV